VRIGGKNDFCKWLSDALEKKKPTWIRRAADASVQFPAYLATAILFVPLLFLATLLNLLITLTRDGKRTFFSPSIFPWTSELESNWKAVRAELESVARNIDYVPNYQDLSEQRRFLSQDDKWKSFLFYVVGRKVEQNCRQCPATVKMLDRIPGLCYAMFSILKPKKHIKAHRGSVWRSA
jgi:beta-hydroxylase